MARVKDKTVFSWLFKIFKRGDGGVHNDHHESLSDEDKIVEDYLEVATIPIRHAANATMPNVMVISILLLTFSMMLLIFMDNVIVVFLYVHEAILFGFISLV